MISVRWIKILCDASLLDISIIIKLATSFASIAKIQFHFMLITYVLGCLCTRLLANAMLHGIAHNS